MVPREKLKRQEVFSTIRQLQCCVVPTTSALLRDELVSEQNLPDLLGFGFRGVAEPFDIIIFHSLDISTALSCFNTSPLPIDIDPYGWIMGFNLRMV